MKKFYYRFTAQHLEEQYKDIIDDYISTGKTSKCPWHNALTPLSNGISSIKQYLGLESKNIINKGFTSNSRAQTTMKVCPGINDILNNCLLIKLPTDLHLTLHDNGTKFIWKTPDGTPCIEIESHHPDQWTPKDPNLNLFKNKQNIKFMFPLQIGSDVPYIFLQPQFHNNVPFTVINGAVDGKYKKSNNLNINTFFECTGNDENYFLKAGTVIAYIWFPEKVKMVYNNKLPLMPLHRKKFIQTNNHN